MAPPVFAYRRPIWRAANYSGVVTLIMLGLLPAPLSHANGAQDVPSTQKAPLPVSATPLPAVEAKPTFAVNGGDLRAIMADQLDKKPDFVVLQLESLPITQHELAGAIRAMPAGMAELGFEEVYRRAMDVTVRQKAMVLRARLEKLDKDPAVIDQGELAFEHVLADAWLRHQADAAVTDKALHDRYDHEIAGKPGPEQVRARVIMVPTEAQASSLIERVQAGADFGELARQQSKDPSAANGGDLGYLTRDAVLPEIGAAMFSLTPGQMTAYPVTTSHGYFIIRVEGRSSKKAPAFEEARATLERELRDDAIKAAIGSVLSNVKFVASAKPAESASPVKP